jgi:hypothetical protein
MMLALMVWSYRPAAKFKDIILCAHATCGQYREAIMASIAKVRTTRFGCRTRSVQVPAPSCPDFLTDIQEITRDSLTYDVGAFAGFRAPA